MEIISNFFSSSLLSNILAVIMVIIGIYEIWDKKIQPKKEANKKALKEKNEKHMQQLQSINEQLNNIYNNIIVKNKFTEKAYIGRIKEITGDELNNNIDIFLEQYNLVVDIYEGCFCIIKTSIESNSRSWLPETIKLNPIQGILTDREIINECLNEINFNDLWLKENHLETYHYILSHLNEKEKGLNIDEFYQSINNVIKKDKTIIRFKKEKIKLINIYQKILSEIKK